MTTKHKVVLAVLVISTILWFTIDSAVYVRIAPATIGVSLYLLKGVPK